MSKCSKCGLEMKDSAKYCKSCGNSLSGQLLTDKKARVISRENTWVKPALISVIVIIVAAGAWMYKESRAANGSGKAMFAPHRDASARTEKAPAVTGRNGDVRIPVKAVEDGNAHFFSYETGGKTISFFAVKADDGSIRTAFDACVACNHAKLGYRQEGKLVVCNNCGLGFKPADIGTVTGGCSPIPVEKAADGETIVIKTKDLDAGVQYF